MPQYWCYHCYARNPKPSGPCVRCGASVEGPPGRTYDEQLVWALSHPDTGQAAFAAQMLGTRRYRPALPALREHVEHDPDPYRAVAALRAAITIAGAEELRPWLEQLIHHRAFMVREIARRALFRRSG